jgi:hypothetical protein
LDLVQNRLSLFGKSQQVFFVLLLIFVGVFLARTVTTSDTNGAFYGVVGRGSGFLTYLSYGLIFILSMIYVNLSNFKFLIRGLLIAGFLGSFYSLLEKLGKNPWKMSQVYEGTSSLFGNPNFSGAFLSLATILSVWMLTNKSSSTDKWLAGVTLPLAIYGVYTSKALQGVISIFIGITLLVLIKLFQIRKPLGIGALILRRAVEIPALLHGGGQEREIRSGTLNAPAIVAFAAAAKSKYYDSAKVSGLRDSFIAGISAALPEVIVNGLRAERLPGIVNITFPGTQSDTLLLLMDAQNISCSTGSACSAGVHEASHVLLAMGHSEVSAQSSLRFSFGATSTGADVDFAVSVLPDVITRGRAANLS